MILKYINNLMINQENNVKMSDILSIILYKRIVVFENFVKFSKNSFQNLDYLIGQGYIVYMSDIRTNTKAT